MSYNLKDPIFIDFEASSLNYYHSFPIEVGLSIPFNNKDYFSKLIKPAQYWRDWSKSSEKIHGITMKDLINLGEDPFDIASLLNELLYNKTVFCDGYKFDSIWNYRLFEAAGIPCFYKIKDIMYLLSEKQILNWNKIKKRFIQKNNHLCFHRAGVDAYSLKKIYLSTLKI